MKPCRIEPTVIAPTLHHHHRAEMVGPERSHHAMVLCVEWDEPALSIGADGVVDPWNRPRRGRVFPSRGSGSGGSRRGVRG